MIGWTENYQEISADTLRLAENAPMIQPKISSTYEASRDNNNLLGKTFQFAYQWVYKDYRFSILSPYSELFVSKELSQDIQTYDNNLENKISIVCQLGNSEVRSLRILAREGNIGNWFVCGKYDKGDPVDTGFYSLDFYDDSVREYIDMTSALATYHNVPLIARNIEEVKNQIVLSDCINGYDPTVVDYTLGIAYGAENSSDPDVTIPVTFTYTPTGVGGTKVDISIEVPSVVKGQTVLLDVKINGSTWLSGREWRYDFNLSRSIYISETLSADAFASTFQDAVRESASFKFKAYSGGVVVEEGQWPLSNVLAFAGGHKYVLLGEIINGLNNGSVYPILVNTNSSKLTYAKPFENTFAKFSSYNVGIAYYDKVGRTNGVLTTAKKSIYIPGEKDRAPSDVGRASYISWVLNSIPPDWAYYYRMCVSDSISFNDIYSVHTNSNCKEVAYDGRTVLALDIWGSSYVFSKGDLLIKEIATGVKTKPVIGTIDTVTPIGETDAVFGNFILVPKDTDVVSGSGGDADYSKCALSIHRYKSSTEEAVYFEDFNTYSVLNPTTPNRSHETLSGVIKSGDTWIRTKNYTYKSDSLYTFTGEEFYINSDLGLKSYSKGRPMVSLKDFGRKDQPIIMWGGKSFYETKTNEIAAFNFSDTMMMDAKHGHITQTKMVGDVFKVLQERKETSIYVGKNVFTDAGGNVSLALVNSLFGNQNSSEADYGVNYKLASMVYGRLLFYWDQDKGVVIQSSPNGQLEISSVGNEGYFKKKKSDIDDCIASGTNFKVLFGYDPRNKELIALFHIGNVAEACVYDVDENKWVFSIDLNKTISGIINSPDQYMILGSHAISTIAGFMYKHNEVDDLVLEESVIYDEHKEIQIKGVLNDYPNIEKRLLGMEINMDGNAFVEAETPKSSTISSQMTRNTFQSLRRKNGRYYAPFLRNIKLPNGTISSDLNMLHNGVQMKGRIAEINIRSNATSDFEFRDIEIEWLPLQA